MRSSMVFEYIRSQKEISFICWTMFILLSAVGATYVIIIVFIQQTFHSVTKDLGFLAVSLTVGLFLGSLGYGAWGKRSLLYKVIFGSLILGGAMVVIFSWVVQATHDRTWALGLSFILGVVVGPVLVSRPQCRYQ